MKAALHHPHPAPPPDDSHSAAPSGTDTSSYNQRSVLLCPQPALPPSPSLPLPPLPHLPHLPHLAPATQSALRLPRYCVILSIFFGNFVFLVNAPCSVLFERFCVKGCVAPFSHFLFVFSFIIFFPPVWRICLSISSKNVNSCTLFKACIRNLQLCVCPG